MLALELYLFARFAMKGVGCPHKVKAAARGKAKLALPTLAIAELPVAELPVRDRLLLWEHSPLLKFSVKDDTRTSEKKDDAAQAVGNDPYTGCALIAKRFGTLRIFESAYIAIFA